MNQDIKLLFEYIRGDLTQEFFEDHFFSDLKFQNMFGEDFWLEIISNDYKNKDTTFKIKEKLKELAIQESNQKCKCLEIRNIDSIDMFQGAEYYLKSIDRIVDRGLGFWWIYLSVCNICSQYWLFGQEERINDVYIVKRLNDVEAKLILEKGIWPINFDKYGDLLHLGKEYGHSARFFNPLFSKSISGTIEDLAKEKPGIKLSEIIALLNLEKDIALEVCTNLLKLNAIDINLNE